MPRRLSEMTLEELWQLFPIILTDHRSVWRDWYAAEAVLLRTLMPGALRISHVGSTAVEGIMAKPIVDILAEVLPACDLDALREHLTANGYLCMNQQPARLSLNKGYTEHGFAEKVFHLHVRLPGDNDELYFRDYLNDRPDVAREYEALKLSLWKPFEHDRDGYTASKGDFVRRHTALARAAYPGRYDLR